MSILENEIQIVMDTNLWDGECQYHNFPKIKEDSPWAPILNMPPPLVKWGCLTLLLVRLKPNINIIIIKK